jgi:hypothetical protein
MTPTAAPTGKDDLTGVRLRLELDSGAVAIVLPHTHVVRVADPDVLDDLARRISAIADTLRRYRALGELPMFGGEPDPHRPDDVWWAD